MLTVTVAVTDADWVNDGDELVERDDVDDMLPVADTLALELPDEDTDELGVGLALGVAIWLELSDWLPVELGDGDDDDVALWLGEAP